MKSEGEGGILNKLIIYYLMVSFQHLSQVTEEKL